MIRRDILIGATGLVAATVIGSSASAQLRPQLRIFNPRFKRWTRRLIDMTPAEQRELADLMRPHLRALAPEHHLQNGAHGFGVMGVDPGAIAGHGVPQGRGATFFEWHRDYLLKLERMINHPLPSWAPWEPIPEAFLEGDIRQPEVGKADFALFSDEVIGHHSDEDTLGVTLSNSAHFKTHALCGGRMAVPNRAAETLIFWPWHTFINDLHRTWQEQRKRYPNGKPDPKEFPWPAGSPSNPLRPGAEQRRVPFCVGLTLDEARRKIEQRGLVVGRINGHSDGLRVIKQAPLPWTGVSSGSRVDLEFKLAEVQSLNPADYWPPLR